MNTIISMSNGRISRLCAKTLFGRLTFLYELFRNIFVTPDRKLNMTANKFGLIVRKTFPQISSCAVARQDDN
jgi:hypothetical protein